MQKYEHAFGKNDIRGIYGKDITEELFFYTGIGYVKYLKKMSGKNFDKIWITVSRDARLHSPALAKSLIQGILSTGANVVDLGLAPTPIGYYSEAKGVPKQITDGEKVIGAAIVTASHNPSEYNGLKMTYSGCTLNEDEIREVKELTFAQMQNQNNESEMQGKLKNYDLVSDYIEDMKNRFMGLCEGVKVVVDSANATGGIVAPKLYRELGCEVTELFSEPDGSFPNHHPNPSVESTLDTLKQVVKQEKADIGIAFDGDSDRIGIVDNEGNYLTGDKLLLIYAQDMIEGMKDNEPVVVSEVKCSQVLFDTIDKIGGKSVMAKTGHGYIKSMMKETGALLAGEMSGHTFFKDRYYGFDDAVYAGCRILEIVSKHKKLNPNFSIKELLKPFNEVYSSSEVRYPCPNELKKSVLSAVQRRIETDPNVFGSPIKDIITLDGMRIIFEGGFALIRQSNTEPVFTLRFEAKDKIQSDMFKNAMIRMLDDELKLTTKL